jgi:hypothetical protein
MLHRTSGYCHPKDGNIDVDEELKDFEMESAIGKDKIEDHDIDLVIPQRVVDKSPYLESMLENLESDIDDEDYFLTPKCLKSKKGIEFKEYLEEDDDL